MDEQLELGDIAYHEAGHAVLHFVLGLRQRHATIKPSRRRGSLGHVEFDVRGDVLAYYEGPFNRKNAGGFEPKRRLSRSTPAESHKQNTQARRSIGVTRATTIKLPILSP